MKPKEVAETNSSWFDIAVSALTKAIEKLYESTPPEQHDLISLLLVLASLLVLAAIASPIAIVIYRAFRSYILSRRKYAKHRVENPGAFAWGNMILRAPLVLIGTDIYCFARLSNRGKLLRFTKAGAVIIPVIWTALGMTIFVVTSKKEFAALDVYISALPVLLVCGTILVLDLSIINDQGGLGIKLTRGFLAVVTGYVLSSVPLNYYFRSSINSEISQKDSESEVVRKDLNDELRRISGEPWHVIWNGLNSNVELLRKQLANERMGLGTSGKPNDSGSNPRYNEIRQELERAERGLMSFESRNASNIARLTAANKEAQRRLKLIEDGNLHNHIKRHNALWRYAFSTVGGAIYFLGILLIFWTVDALAVLTSFIVEDEYQALLQRSITSVSEHFDAQDFETQFFPVISEGDAA